MGRTLKKNFFLVSVRFSSMFFLVQVNREFIQQNLTLTSQHLTPEIKVHSSVALSLHFQRIIQNGLLINWLSCSPGDYYSVADPDPGSGIWCFLTPGLGIPNPYFWELSDICFGKKFYNSLKIGPIFFLQHFTNKIIFNFVKLGLQKKIWQLFFHPSLLLLFLEPGSGIRDPGRVKIRIRDKHPGSATPVVNILFWFYLFCFCYPVVTADLGEPAVSSSGWRAPAKSRFSSQTCYYLLYHCRSFLSNSIENLSLLSHILCSKGRAYSISFVFALPSPSNVPYIIGSSVDELA